MKQEQLLKSIDLIKEYNNDMFSKLRTINRIQAGKSKNRKTVSKEEIEEVLVLISILLAGNIKVRYELEDWAKENKAFANLTQLKAIATNAKQDIDALKSASYNMTEVLKSIRQKEEDEKYKQETL